MDLWKLDECCITVFMEKTVKKQAEVLKGLKRNTAVAAEPLQSCPTLCDPTDGSPPGSSVCGIFQARVLE